MSRKSTILFYVHIMYILCLGSLLFYSMYILCLGSLLYYSMYILCLGSLLYYSMQTMADLTVGSYQSRPNNYSGRLLLLSDSMVTHSQPGKED